jgi:hypothetical protein
MLFSTCDLCKTNCPVTTTRRWEHIFGELGLEVVILRGHKPVGDTHICDECILKMFWVMLEKSNSTLKQIKLKLSSREAVCSATEYTLSKQTEAVELKLNELRELEKQISGREKVLEMPNEILEQNKVLKVENEELKNREVTAIRRAEARGRQQAIDEREYPEYVNSVFQREIKRHGGF